MCRSANWVSEERCVPRRWWSSFPLFLVQPACYLNTTKAIHQIALCYTQFMCDWNKKETITEGSREKKKKKKNQVFVNTKLQDATMHQTRLIQIWKWTNHFCNKSATVCPISSLTIFFKVQWTVILYIFIFFLLALHQNTSVTIVSSS